MGPVLRSSEADLVVVMLISGLVIGGLVIDLGGGPDHERIGFRYWRTPGAVAGSGLEPKHIHLDRFLGIVGVLVQAAFSFQGMELVAVSVRSTDVTLPDTDRGSFQSCF